MSSLILRACILISLFFSLTICSNSSIFYWHSVVYLSNIFFYILCILKSLSLARARTAVSLLSSSILSSALIKWYGLLTSCGISSWFSLFYLRAYFKSRIVSSSLIILSCYYLELRSKFLYCSFNLCCLSFSDLNSSIKLFIL